MPNDDAVEVAAAPAPPQQPAPPAHAPGGYRELIALSLPLILGTSFWTIQILVDRIFLTAAGANAVAAAMPAVGYFWTPMALIHNTVMYVTVFVAQYAGAKRPGRIGPVVWQAFYFSVGAGLLFPLLSPIVDALIGLTKHEPEVKELESIYFASLTLAALPMCLVGAVNGFFAGRGQSWTVLLINAVGTSTNAALAVPFIWMQRHDPAAAMAGAGYAAALGSSASALLGLVLFFRAKFRAEYCTLTGWRFDPKLFLRLMRFGLPNGLQWCIEGVSFTLFILLIGNIGPRELTATTLTFSLNMLTFLPVLGLGQGVEVLVGRRQGEGRPDLSAKTTWAGATLATVWMAFVGVLYCTIPGWMTLPFAWEMKPAEWEAVGPLVPVLLRYVAAYSLADGVNIILAYALRGAGDTRFVVLVAIGLSWPLMVIPTWAAAEYGWGIEAAWAAATVYIAVATGVYVLRHLGGKWRTMKVIETPVVVDSTAAIPAPSANGDGAHP